MNNDSFISKFIAFYKTKKGKAICFFGFYLIFFIILIAFINVNPTDTPNIEDVKEEVLYNTALLENNDYTYNYVIESNEIKEFNGIKNDDNIELNEYEYNYFLNLYNIKQLVKKSKYLSTTTFKDNTCKLDYTIDNETLNNYFEHDYTENLDNNITINTDENKNVTGFVLDLSNFFNEKMVIKINYKVGEDNA